MLLEIDVAFFRNQRRIGRHAVSQPEGRGLANLFKVRGVEKEFHKTLLRILFANQYKRNARGMTGEHRNSKG